MTPSPTLGVLQFLYMDDVMKFKSHRTKIGADLYIASLRRYTDDNEFLEFFEANNVASPVVEACIKTTRESLSFDFFLGRSKEREKDYLKVNKEYAGRIPDGFSAISRVNEIDYLCVGPHSGFYLWSRYKNDLYFDAAHPNKYKQQDKNLLFLTDRFSDLLGMIEECAREDDLEKDDYENPEIPFDDEDIEDDFKHPELFFKQSPDAVAVQLRKLKLSPKGEELLSLFAERKLLP